MRLILLSYSICINIINNQNLIDEKKLLDVLSCFSILPFLSPPKVFKTGNVYMKDKKIQIK